MGFMGVLSVLTCIETPVREKSITAAKGDLRRGD